MLVDETDRKSLERSLAAHLIEAGKLEEPVLERVLRLQRGNEERLEALLVKLGFAGERDVAEALAEQLDRYAQRAVEMASGLPVLPVLALPSELEAAYARLYDAAAPLLGQTAGP